MITPPATSTTFPDVSNWQNGLKFSPGTPAVLAKATEGVDYVDASFHLFQQQAAAIGALFSGYHYLVSGDAAYQAAFCRGVVGDTPTVLDMERTNQTAPSIAEALTFVDNFQEREGRLWALYLPKWYWTELGEPDLTPFVKRGLILISSDYSDDVDAGFSSYGGVTPAIRQFTSSYQYGGRSIDYNEFRGTPAALAALMNGDDMPSVQEIWNYKGDDANAAAGPDDPDVHQSLLTTRDDVADIKTAMTALAERVEQIAVKVGA